MKYIKLFENFLNEELRSSTYYDFSKFLQRDIVELAKRTKGLDVENIKSVVVDSIIEFYEIEDNEQNRDKVNKSFVLQSLPLENPDFYEVIVRQYYILDKDTEKDRRLRTDFYNNVKFIEIVDNREWDRYYDRIEELLENPNKFPKYKMPQWERELWQQLKQGWKGQVHQKGIDTLRKKLSVYFPEEIKSKGKGAVIEFRIWFETIKHLYLFQPDTFVFRLHAKYGIITNPKAIKHENSGVFELENPSITELEQEIDKLIKEAGRFYYSSEKNTEILKLKTEIN
jgi:hypothetical protein